MDYLLTEEQTMLQDLARKITEERIKPIRAQLDEEEIFPTEIKIGRASCRERV